MQAVIAGDLVERHRMNAAFGLAALEAAHRIVRNAEQMAESLLSQRQRRAQSKCSGHHAETLRKKRCACQRILRRAIS